MFSEQDSSQKIKIVLRIVILLRQSINNVPIDVFSLMEVAITHLAEFSRNLLFLCRNSNEPLPVSFHLPGLNRLMSSSVYSLLSNERKSALICPSGNDVYAMTILTVSVAQMVPPFNGMQILVSRPLLVTCGCQYDRMEGNVLLHNYYSFLWPMSLEPV